MPRIARACASASSASFASLMPPALPRPPIWTWALTTTGKPSSSAASRACSGVVACRALGHGHAVLGEQLLALVLEQVHVSFRPPALPGDGALRQPSAAPTGADAINKPERKALPLPKNIDFRQPRGLRHPDRLGDRHLRGLPKEAEKDGFTIDRDQLIPLFIETQREIMSGSYELYAEVLRRTAVKVAEELGWELEPVRSSFLPNSIPSWPPFRDANAMLERLRRSTTTRCPKG